MCGVRAASTVVHELQQVFGDLDRLSVPELDEKNPGSDRATELFGLVLVVDGSYPADGRETPGHHPGGRRSCDSHGVTPGRTSHSSLGGLAVRGCHGPTLPARGYVGRRISATAIVTPVSAVSVMLSPRRMNRIVV